MPEIIRRSVGELVGFLLRRGDIDGGWADPQVMYEGAKAHRSIQKSMGDGYLKEVPLSGCVCRGDLTLELSGRADGIISNEEYPVIDEIKTTSRSFAALERDGAMHRGQALCYAYLFAKTLEIPPQRMAVQLTYCNLDTQEIRRSREEIPFPELEAFFDSLTGRYLDWMERARDWRALRDESIRALAFPFPAYRKGQREMAAGVFRSIRDGVRLYAQAPTGIGKTISALFPAVKAAGEGLCGKIFYLTAKTVTRQAAKDALNRMEAAGLRFKSVAITAKDKICPLEERACNPEQCPRARGHYDRLLPALEELLGGADRMTRRVVEECAARHTVCPYELSLDAAVWADCVVCDYNYVFDPVVYLRRFFQDGVKTDCVFLIDEAHNLDGRVREMLTASVSEAAYAALRRACKDKSRAGTRLRRCCRNLTRRFRELAESGGGEARKCEYDPVLTALCEEFCGGAEEWLAQAAPADALPSGVLELYFETLFFKNIAGRYDERYATLAEPERGGLRVTLFCLDPSAHIADTLGKGRSAALFSATLTPLPYYRDLLGGSEEDRTAALPSPFDSRNLCIAAHTGISTKYRDRQAGVAPVAQALEAAVRMRRGNYMVFLPSYEYMEQIAGAFEALCPDLCCIRQQSGMDEEERRAFLARFDGENPETLVGFCVLGGMFSEGIDLRGERLIGSLIVGVGLPKITLRGDLIMEYFQRENGMGYDYAYRFPGMNKVLQAAGRVIRGETDRGIVLLIDSRWAEDRYRRLFPAHWRGLQSVRDLPALRGVIGDWHSPREQAPGTPSPRTGGNQGGISG